MYAKVYILKVPKSLAPNLYDIREKPLYLFWGALCKVSKADKAITSLSWSEFYKKKSIWKPEGKHLIEDPGQWIKNSGINICDEFEGVRLLCASRNKDIGT